MYRFRDEVWMEEDVKLNGDVGGNADDARQVEDPAKIV
jgi:hypothetical protein